MEFLTLVVGFVLIGITRALTWGFGCVGELGTHARQKLTDMSFQGYLLPLMKSICYPCPTVSVTLNDEYLLPSLLLSRQPRQWPRPRTHKAALAGCRIKCGMTWCVARGNAKVVRSRSILIGQVVQNVVGPFHIIFEDVQVHASER